MNSKLIVLVGISGSGKSTWATNYIKENPGTVRVNRDDMRKQILGELTQGYYDKNNGGLRNELEKHITVLQNEQIRYWLLEGFNVIADNTHLRKGDVENYVKNFRYLADIYIKPIYVDPYEAVRRVIERDGIGVDASYIDKQYKQFTSLDVVYYENNSSTGILSPKRETPLIKYDEYLSDCYIVDLDGTIADCTGVRSPYDGEKLYLDKAIVPVRNILNQLHGCEIIYVSGREDKWMEASKNWISNHCFPDPDLVYMRKTGDFRPDTVVKKEIYEENIKGKYNVLGIFDDRISVSRSYVDELGLFVFNVNQKMKLY